VIAISLNKAHFTSEILSSYAVPCFLYYAELCPSLPNLPWSSHFSTSLSSAACLLLGLCYDKAWGLRANQVMAIEYTRRAGADPRSLSTFPVQPHPNAKRR
jgi:hypothetical protein